MNPNVKLLILELLGTKQLSYSDICKQCPTSPTQVSGRLKELLEQNEIIKSRVGKNVFYALRGHDLLPETQSNKLTVYEVLDRSVHLTFAELLVKCDTLTKPDVSKALANLVFDGRVFRHRKEQSRVTHYSTSNFVKDYLLVNGRRRNQAEPAPALGPYLREFLFNLPIPA